MFIRACIIAILTSAALLTSAPARAADDPSKAKTELERIQRELTGIKKKATETGKKEKSVLTEIEKMDRKLSAKRAEVKKLEKHLGKVSSELETTAQEMENTNSKLAERQGSLKERLRAMYTAGRAGGAWALLMTGDYGGTLKRYKYLSVMSQRDKTLVDRYASDLDELARHRELLGEKRRDYDSLRAARDKEAKKVAAQEEDKKRLLVTIRKQKGSYEAMARELEESSRRMQALIQRIEAESKAREKAASKPPASGAPGAPKPHVAAAPPGSFPSLKAGLDWPVAGKVISRFGRQKHPDFDTYIDKKGIEIQAGVGSDVRAVEAAEVAFADWFKGLGLVAILHHGGDYYTVYAHLSGLRVKTGDRVSKGQNIASVGDSGASGPSLYFEVRRGASAQDPLRWLRRR
ncbi:MAG: peptidoglycan DD-metalloendopeptidase family protein [Nitrospirae bacterium]|nr:peptidoglycan DD-metalloendopeptidase family protein [Nitrospirota bacterium]